MFSLTHRVRESGMAGIGAGLDEGPDSLAANRNVVVAAVEVDRDRLASRRAAVGEVGAATARQVLSVAARCLPEPGLARPGAIGRDRVRGVGDEPCLNGACARCGRPASLCRAAVRPQSPWADEPQARSVRPETRSSPVQKTGFLPLQGRTARAVPVATPLSPSSSPGSPAAAALPGAARR